MLPLEANNKNNNSNDDDDDMGYAFRESVLTFSFLFIDAFLYAHQFVVSFAGKLLYRTKKEHVKNFIQSRKKNEEKTLVDYRVKLLKANFIHMNNCVYEWAGERRGPIKRQKELGKCLFNISLVVFLLLLMLIIDATQSIIELFLC